MADELRVGEFNPDGSIKQDVRVSVLSGRRTEAGDPMVGISGTLYFYRLEAQEFRLLHDESDPDALATRRAELSAIIKLNLPSRAAPVVKPTQKDDKGVTNG
jgi:hypothetical protein